MPVDPNKFGSEEDEDEKEVVSAISEDEDVHYVLRPTNLEDSASYIWLLSFTDVMALMLTFFVLLFSMSEPVRKDWAGMTDSLKQEFNQFEGARFEHGKDDVINLDKVNFNRALKTAYIESLLQSEWSENEQLSAVQLVRQRDRLIVSIASDAVFDGDTSQITDSGRKILYAVAGPLSRIKNRIEIEGNLTPGAVGSSRKWNLTMQRSLAVATVMRDLGYSKNIAIRGNATGRYIDLEPVEDIVERRAMSRTLDIIIRTDDGERPYVREDILK